MIRLLPLILFCVSVLACKPNQGDATTSKTSSVATTTDTIALRLQQWADHPRLLITYDTTTTLSNETVTRLAIWGNSLQQKLDATPRQTRARLFLELTTGFENPASKKKALQEMDRIEDFLVMTFGKDQNDLPVLPILKRLVHCAACDHQTVVKTNIVQTAFQDLGDGYTK